MSNILNISGQSNYIAGQKIFLLDTLNRNTCSELIGNITNMVNDMPWGSTHKIHFNEITNPYQISFPATPIIDIYINSTGGDTTIMNSIMTQINLARARGAIIRTTVMGQANSCASLIAIQGTPGFRIMYEQAYNLIHYGNVSYNISKEEEIERIYKHTKEVHQASNKPYLEYTNLTQKDLKKLERAEHGRLSAPECMAKNMCDWILSSQGTFIKRAQKSR